MAPSNGPAAAGTGTGLANPSGVRKGFASKPVARKRIEPAIPLPYLQRRPKQPTTNPPLPSPLRTNSEETPPTRNNVQEQIRAAVPGDEIANHKNLPIKEVPASAQEVEQEEAAGREVKDDRPRLQGAEPVPAGPATQTAVTHPSMAGDTTPPGINPYPAQTSNTFSQFSPDNDLSAPSSASYPPPSMSPTPYNSMRPPFHPGNNHPVHFRGPIPEPIRLPQHNFNQPRMHQHNVSNGSLVFGGFHGSTTPSPAPHSGGAFPPPVPMAHEQKPVSSIDAFGRPLASAAPIDGHAPIPMNHGPVDPHSFHGSQSSRNAEDSFSSKPMVNGQNGVDVGRPGPPPGAARVPFQPNNQSPFSSDGLEFSDAIIFTEQISSMFARPDFADCEVSLVLPDRLTSINSQRPGAQNGPLRLPAHQIILSTNEILRSIMQEQPRHPDGSREIRITSADPFLRADAMWRAIKYVYGFRFVPMPILMEKESDVEKFHFALGYAAAGALLQVPHISISAMREASKWLSWDTVEKGLEFALTESVVVLNGMMDVPHTPLFPHFRYKHGIYVNELVEKMMMFIMNHFPSNFALDTTVEDPRYARLPALAVKQPGPDISEHNASVGQVSSRLASINIKFGDMDPSENNGRGRSPASQYSGGYTAALSRILINLPFEMVKLLLESNGLGGVSGWQTAQDRRRVMPDVIAEREARRLRFVSELRGGRYTGQFPKEGLQSRDPQLLEGGWSNVCWREQCILNGEAPIMARTWEPLPLGGGS